MIWKLFRFTSITYFLQKVKPLPVIMMVIIHCTDIFLEDIPKTDGVKKVVFVRTRGIPDFPVFWKNIFTVCNADMHVCISKQLTS